MSRYLKNPKTGAIYVETDLLKARGDMVPCEAPKKAAKKPAPKPEPAKEPAPKPEPAKEPEAEEKDAQEGADDELIARIEAAEDADELRDIAKANFGADIPGNVKKLETIREKVLVMAREG